MLAELREYEWLCNTLFNQTSQSKGQTQQDANIQLEAFNKDPANFSKFKAFLSISGNKYAQYLSACALKNCLEECWKQIPYSLKVQLTEYLLNCFNEQIVLVTDSSVVNMQIVLLAKLLKLSWFDECPEQEYLRSIVNELKMVS